MTAGGVRLIEGDCLEALKAMPDGSVDCVVTDPPYALTPGAASEEIGHPSWNGSPSSSRSRKGAGFMGLAWDADLPGAEHWAAALRAARPGGYLLAFGGSRTHHRLTCAIEDAGWEVRDCLMWLYGTGFPKGRGCLKPAYEPIVLARAPGPRVLPLGIDGCRTPAAPWARRDGASGAGFKSGKFCGAAGVGGPTQQNGSRQGPAGRYPANVLHDGSDEVLGAFAAFGERKSGGANPVHSPRDNWRRTEGRPERPARNGGHEGFSDEGTAARFFYCAKASRAERGDGNGHPTVKPLALMRWLVRLACPEGGTALDPFAGSGTTGLAALQEGRKAVLIEREPAYCEIIRRRLAEAEGPLFSEAKCSQRHFS